MKQLAPGNTVTVSTWRGEVTALARGNVEQRASGNPDFGPEMHAILAMEATVLGGWSLLGGLTAARGTGRTATRGVRAVLRPLVLPIITTALLPLPPALLARGSEGALSLIGALTAWAALEALALWLLRSRLSPHRA